MVAQWSSGGRKQRLQRVNGRLGVDALGSRKEYQSVTDVMSSEEVGQPYALVCP